MRIVSRLFSLTHFMNRLCLRRPAVLFGLLSCLFFLTLLLQWFVVPNGIKVSEYSSDLGSALREDGVHFVLDGENIRIISGAVHYFRMPQEYWKDRLLKLKAIGANTVETYCPWNAHEPKPNKFDFSGNLDLAAYLSLAQSLGLYVILRPGPYICSEWDFGGLPAWLLADPNMKIRSNYHGYAYPAKRYLKKVYEITSPYMRTTKKGPIIMIQIENEYADYPQAKNNPGHLRYLQKVATDSGIREKFVTSDGSWHVAKGGYDNVLKTVNLADVGKGFSKINRLTDNQPDRPMMVMEYWSGWFDHWSFPHETRESSVFEQNLEAILDYNEGSSVNIYMFFGGTNFGFMNGANTDPHTKPKDGPSEYLYQSDVSSYDYDAPLTELGHMTEKFFAARRMISEKLGISVPDIRHLMNSSLSTYSKPKLTGYASLWDMLRFVKPNNVVKLDQPVAMEFLPIHQNTGQGYGYTFYETILDVDTTKPVSLEGFKNNYRDRATVYQNRNKVASFDQNSGRDSVMFQSRQKTVRLQILTENAGRVNYGEWLEDQRKGLFSPISTRGEDIFDWKIYALEFDPEFMGRVNYTEATEKISDSMQKAGLWKFTISENEILCDTFIDTTMLEKGILFVNGHNLGRFWKRGPTIGLFCPGVWLKYGKNELIIFEEMEIIMSDRGVDFMKQIKYIDIL